MQQAAAQLLSVLGGTWSISSIGRSVTVGQDCLDIMVIFFTGGSPGSPRPGSDVCTHRERFLRKITTKCQNCNHMLKNTAGTIIEQVLKLLSRHWDHMYGTIANYVPNLLWKQWEWYSVQRMLPHLWNVCILVHWCTVWSADEKGIHRRYIFYNCGLITS